MRRGFVVSSYTNISQVLGKSRLPLMVLPSSESPTSRYPCSPQTGSPVHHAASPQCRPVRAMCLPAPRMRETQNSLTWISISGFTISTTFCLLTLYKVLQGVGIRQEAWIKYLGSRFETKLEREGFWGMLLGLVSRSVAFVWADDWSPDSRKLRLTLDRSRMLKRTALALRSWISARGLRSDRHVRHYCIQSHVDEL